MSEWIECSDRLPIQQPEGWPTYNWVLVTAERKGTGEPWPFTIARYTKDGWDFWENKHPEAPCFGDTSDQMFVDEITHWMPLYKPRTLNDIHKECQECGHFWTWMPKIGRICVRCGLCEEGEK